MVCWAATGCIAAVLYSGECVKTCTMTRGGTGGRGSISVPITPSMDGVGSVPTRIWRGMVRWWCTAVGAVPMSGWQGGF